MPLWLHAFIGTLVSLMGLQIYRAMKVGKVMDSLTEIDRGSSPRYFNVLKYGYIVGLIALLILWVTLSVAFGIR